eukprot:TRINITY_DN13698_c0_g1_i1.p1 TRINITY_DN13698_c0_g1~~TRINITY_DN13698_c0_g1_i1.p1  ORF type:complete len:385 (-),score=78.60 TRINITY_DN13698_c0_g1_i1:53-1156(-)
MARISFLATFVVITMGLNSLVPNQLNSERRQKTVLGKSEESLPEVGELLPSRTFSTMKSTVAKLAKRLAEEQNQSAGALKQMRANYGRTIALQKTNNSVVRRKNAFIASRVEVAQKKNKGLRLRAGNLITANSVLKNQLGYLGSNISLAQEFVQEGLAASMTNTSEFAVLDELAKLDEVAHTISRKQALLRDFGHGKAVSLIESVGDVHERSTNDIVDTLSSSLAELAIETNTSQSVLHDAFEKQLSDEIEKHNALMREQSFLNKSISEAEELRDRLSAAVRHLSNIHEALLARIKGVKAFAVHLGGRRGSHDLHQSQNGIEVKEATTDRQLRSVHGDTRSHSRQEHVSRNVTESQFGLDGSVNHTR